jgi:hypothetical protein
VVVFYRLDHPLKRRFETLKDRCIPSYSDVLPLKIISSESLTRHKASAPGYSFATFIVFYTDGSLIDGCAGYAIHRTEESGFGYNKIPSMAGIFTAQLTAFTAY